MADDKGVETPVSANELFKRQTIAGVEGNPPLNSKEQKALIELNAKRPELASGGLIPPHIVELQKKAANAGIGDNPNLSPEDQKELADYYASRK